MPGSQFWRPSGSPPSSCDDAPPSDPLFLMSGRGEVDPALRATLRALVLLDAGVENLVVEERGRLWFEEDTGSLLVDHLVILRGQWNDAELEVRLRPGPLGDHPQTACLVDLVHG
jgi:hypothetical protein